MTQFATDLTRRVLIIGLCGLIVIPRIAKISTRLISIVVVSTSTKIIVEITTSTTIETISASASASVSLNRKQSIVTIHICHHSYVRMIFRQINNASEGLLFYYEKDINILKTCSFLSCMYSCTKGLILVRKSFKHDMQYFFIINLNTNCSKTISRIFDLLEKCAYRI